MCSNSDKQLNHRPLFHKKMSREIIGFMSNFIKVFISIMLGLKLDPAPPTKERTFYLWCISCQPPSKWPEEHGSMMEKWKKRYLWRNTSKRSWLLGKNNFIFLLGDYNLLLRKKDQFVLKAFFVKMKCICLSKNSINVERNCFLYWWITDYIKRRLYDIIYCIANPLG